MLLMACKNVSNRLQMGKCSKTIRPILVLLLKEFSKKAIFLKNEATKTLLQTVKNSILEPEKTTALSDEACLPRLCFERNFMMEDTL